MKTKSAIACSTLVLLGCSALSITQSAHAFNPMNMMNPSKWMGGNNRNYDDDYYYDRYGGYGGGPWGYNRGWGPGWGGYGPGYGYGWPGYGPGYGYGAPAYGQSGSGTSAPPPVPQ